MTTIARKIPRVLLNVFIVAAGYFAFCNNFDHAYHLDSTHGLKNNAYVRSLSHIPRYFVDPLTLTTYRSNGDYRPILQITYALNYAISGYDTWSWHLLQILLHVWCAVCLFWLVRRAGRLSSAGDRKLAGDDDECDGALSAIDVAAFAVALLFVIHPTASGVINYLWARSSLLVAAFLLPSFLLFLREAERGRVHVGSAALYALALFTKIEAVAALAVYLFAQMLVQRTKAESPRSLGRALIEQFRLSSMRKLVPFFVITIVYGVIRFIVVPDFTVEMRASLTMQWHTYLLTQTTTWWYYVLRWFAPINLIADYTTYPVFRSIAAPEVMLAISGWLVVFTMLWRLWYVRPAYVFFAMAAFALISPHSSFSPLAEMVNEHRPYLPIAIASAAWVVPFVLWAQRDGIGGRGLKIAQWIVFLAVCGVLIRTTLARNEVFRSERSYWADVVEKSPSGRSLMNYGLTFLGRARYGEALSYFDRALEKSPNWFVAHINAAIANDMLGDQDKAKHHFARAIKLERHTALAYRYRGESHIRHRRYDEAIADFVAAMPKTHDHCRLNQLIGQCYYRKGDADTARQYLNKCKRTP